MIDAGNIILLYRQLGCTTVDQGLDLVEQAARARTEIASRTTGTTSSPLHL